MNKLKLANIQRLSLNCGLAKSGTKKELISGISRGVDECKLAAKPKRLLSVDMGVRNLALCQLNLESNSHPSSTAPLVERWSILELDRDGGGLPFEQPNFAKLAVQLVKQFELDECDTIVIEKQRLRSNGLRNVPEWVARVNLMEAMVHAILQNYLDLSMHHYDVFSVNPSRVMNYWVRGSPLDSKQESKKLNPNARYRHTKNSKVELVNGWLESTTTHNVPFKLADNFVQSFEDPRYKKKDDMADALLQGLAWIQWQENIEQLSKIGLEDGKLLEAFIEKTENEYFSILP